MGRPALMRSAVVILQARNIMKWHDIGLEYGLCHLHYWGLIQAYLTTEVCQQPEHICICWSNLKKRNFESFGNWKTDWVRKYEYLQLFTHFCQNHHHKVSESQPKQSSCWPQSQNNDLNKTIKLSGAHGELQSRIWILSAYTYKTFLLHCS